MPGTQRRGRPSTGKALSNAERQRRYIARLKAGHRVTDERPPPPEPSNPEHRRLFTIPVSTSKALAVHKPLPERTNRTGDPELDAYLWLMDLCRTTTDPADLDRAEEAARRVKASPAQLAARYQNLLLKAKKDPLSVATAAFSIRPIGDVVQAARERLSVTNDGLSIFGSFERAMMATPAEQMLERTADARGVVDAWKWPQSRLAKAFAKSVNPSTLSDAVFELKYWQWLREVRGAMAATDGRDRGEDFLLGARESWVTGLLGERPPTDRAEARYIFTEIRNGLVDAGGTSGDAERREPTLLNLLAYLLGSG